MKALHFTILSLLFLSFTNLKAQEWAPIGAEWRYKLATPTDDFYTMIRIEKDTIIAGQECRQYVIYNQTIGSTSNSFNSEGFTFERNDSIFFWQENTFLLRYDFSANTGDTIRLPSPILQDDCIMEMDSFRVVLDSITMEDMNGVSLEKFHASPIDGAYSYYANSYFRVIGSIHLWEGLLLETDGLCVFIPFGPADLRCYKDADHEIFGIETDCSFPSAINGLIGQNTLRLYPNPVKNQLNLQYDPVLLGANYRLLNQLGVVFRIGKLPNVSTQITIFIDQLRKGIYYLEVTNEKKRDIWKVLKM